MAAPILAGRSIRNPVSLLAAAVKRNYHTQSTNRQAKTRRSILPRRQTIYNTISRFNCLTKVIEPARKRDFIYHSTSRFSNFAVPLYRTSRYYSRNADRQSQPERDRSINRFFCQQFGAARRFIGKSHFSGTIASGKKRRNSSLRSPRFALREVG